MKDRRLGSTPTLSFKSVPDAGACTPSPSAECGRRGISMVELLLGIVLTALCLMAIESSLLTSRTLFYRQKVLTQAISVAESLTEELLLLDSSDPALDPGVHRAYCDSGGVPIEVDGEGLPVGDAYYRISWDVTELVEVPGIRTIEIVTAWDETGTERSIQWRTYRN